MNNPSRAVVLVIAFATSAIACGTTAPQIIESWAADFPALQETLFMNFERTGDTVQGSGTVAGFTNFNVVQLSLSGTRIADTLDITYVRPDATRLHFLGHYVQ